MANYEKKALFGLDFRIIRRFKNYDRDMEIIMQDTLYIAEPLFSQRLQDFDREAVFPPIKKIGITTGEPARREKELLGTVSPVKVAIRKAWGNINAREVETMLHDLLDNCRLDGEYFWDGNDTLLDSVSIFITRYYPQAVLLLGDDDPEVKAADKAVDEGKILRVAEHLEPAVQALGVKYDLLASRKGVRIYLDAYTLRIAARSTGNADKYTMYVLSSEKSAEQALVDFPGTELPNFRADTDPEDSKKKSMMGMRHLEDIIASVRAYLQNNAKNS